MQPEHVAFQQPSAQLSDAQVSAQPKSRSGALLAGLAVGALIGGIVGGGVAAVVASNVSSPSVAQGGGTLTLNNPDSATTVSGVAAVATPSVVTLEVTGSGASGSGSGVIYSEDGYIITNAHVVTLNVAGNDNAEIRVKLSDGRILDGALVGYDPYADIAVVKVEAESLPAITVADSSELNVGDLTVAIGAPLNLQNTVTSGVVSALDRGISVGSQLLPQEPSQSQEGEGGLTPWDFRFGNPNQGQPEAPQQAAGGTVTLPVIQTDASINPGNSGGALLNSDGELIGINVAIASTAGSSDTAGSVGLGFAIPSNLAQRVADALIAGERPSHGLLGASVADSSLATNESRDVSGGLIMEVSPGGAAEKAGLRKGDVITAIDGVPAADGTSVSALVRVHPGNSTVTIEYSRNGKIQETEVTLGNLSE
ncbi:S1C family serine protease [Leucobacter insecticola]|nr:trypsin-like peptidase domain-containing protein [Leucobacter insecticola]